MSESTKKNLPERANTPPIDKSFSRKKFLKYAGMSAAAAITLGIVGCEEDGPMGHGPDPEPGTVNLGAGDLGILNYAYALEQLEAAFYNSVVDTPYNGMSSDEGKIFEAIRDHEVAHRDFFKAAISSVAPDGIIPGLTPVFDGIDFTSRDNVLTVAMTYEDLGVSAYNGTGDLLDSTEYLLQAGKIVSVEARHASIIRSLIKPGTGYFAGDAIVSVDTGLGLATDPADVLAAAAPFIAETIDASGLPQPK